MRAEKQALYGRERDLGHASTVCERKKGFAAVASRLREARDLRAVTIGHACEVRHSTHKYALHSAGVCGVFQNPQTPNTNPQPPSPSPKCEDPEVTIPVKAVPARLPRTNLVRKKSHMDEFGEEEIRHIW
jgi:hypothetical protein